MAKTDWTLTDTVKPDDFNNIGREINQLRTDVDHIEVPAASLTEAGVVQLSNATDSTSEAQAATSKAVKAAYDLAQSSLTAGNERKAEVVAALVAKGIPASTNDSWDSLLSKMTGIIKATGNAAPADLLAGKTASNASGPITGTMLNRGAGGTVTPGTANQSKPAGYYSSPITVLGDADLVPGNIRKGVNLFNVDGSFASMGHVEAGNKLFITSFQNGGVEGLSSLPKKVAAVKVYLNGTYQVSFELNSNNYEIRCRIYVSGTPASEEMIATPSSPVDFWSDFSVNGGDTIELWVYTFSQSARGFYSSFRAGIDPSRSSFGENLIL